MRWNFLLWHTPLDGKAQSLGFFSSRHAAEEEIRLRRLQPSYRECSGDFSIEDVALDRILRFSNATDRVLELSVEPWAGIDEIPAGSSFAIHYATPLDREDSSFAQLEDGSITFWCAGSTYELEVDGKSVI